MAWQFDVQDMNLEEMEMLAEHLGLSTFADLQRWSEEAKKTQAISIPTVRFMAWMAKRSEDPTFTIEQAKTIKLKDLEGLFASPNADGGEAASSSNGKGPSSSSTRGQSRRNRSGV